MSVGVTVLEVYRITLLSNKKLTEKQLYKVLEVYRITLLSNGKDLGIFML